MKFLTLAYWSLVVIILALGGEGCIDDCGTGF